jgi:hypothetical protein
MVPVECRRERPVIRSMIHLYGVNIAVRGKKEERKDIKNHELWAFFML